MEFAFLRVLKGGFIRGLGRIITSALDEICFCPLAVHRGHNKLTGSVVPCR
jgi:hypothetical protein